MPATSSNAAPMATEALPISPHSIEPKSLNASAKSSRPSITITIEPAANKLENPAILPKAARTPPTSTRAPPMAVNPLLISDHSMEPNFLSASAMSPRLLDRISIETAPNMLENLLTFFSMANAPSISARAPPIAASPLPISGQDIEPNLISASAMILQLFASASIATLVDNGTFTFFIILSAIDNSSIAPPIPANPCIICIKDNLDNLTIAFANVSIAFAISTRAMPACIIPVG